MEDRNALLGHSPRVVLLGREQNKHTASLTLEAGPDEAEYNESPVKPSPVAP